MMKILLTIVLITKLSLQDISTTDLIKMIHQFNEAIAVIEDEIEGREGVMRRRGGE